MLFDEEGNAFVADLGVDEICTGITTFATDPYDAPERFGGVLATPATDLYALGTLVHHLLSGSSPPLDGPLPLSDSAVDMVVARATDPDPTRRQSSVEELVADLRDALTLRADSAAPFLRTRNPYRGLAAFEQADADDFHGRDRAVRQMVEILGHERLLVVVGPSGIGKSSVLKAGLLPALAAGALPGSETWLVTEMVPGQLPFERLAAALGRVATLAAPDVAGELAASPRSLDDIAGQLLADDTELVVVVDQFEELFTQTIDEGERRAFLEMISDIAGGAPGVVRLVATLRADFFDRPLGYPGVSDAFEGRTVAIGAMTETELADAVRLPATRLGIEVDPRLVERITSEASTQPGALPLVQHTMAELFDGRQSNAITLAAFEEWGGLAGAIGRRTEEIYAGFDEVRRETARHLFLRLVSVSEDGGDTRRRVRRTELEQLGLRADDLQAVLDEYGRHRLLTFDRDPTSRTPTVEVAHEWLLTEWERFAGWVDDARDDLLSRRRLESASHDWMSSGSDPSFLYGGGRLELAESWAAGSGFELTDDEHRFLATSRATLDREQVVRTRRRRVVMGVLATALVVAVIGASIALVQRRSADRQAEIAEEQQHEAERQSTIADEQRQEAERQAAMAEAQRQEAERQAAIADDQRQTAEVEADRADNAATLAEARRVSTQALATEDHDRALLLAVEGRHLDDSSETRSNLLEAIQRSPHAVAVMRSDTEAFLDLALTRDGTTLVASGIGGPSTLSTFDVATRTQTGSITTQDHRVSSAISPDGRLAVMSSRGGAGGTRTLKVVDTATLAAIGEPLSTGDTEWPSRPSFSRDGRVRGGCDGPGAVRGGCFRSDRVRLGRGTRWRARRPS